MKFKRYENKSDSLTLTLDLDEILSVVCSCDGPHGLLSVLFKNNSNQLQFRSNIEFLKKIEKDISEYLVYKTEV